MRKKLLALTAIIALLFSMCMLAACNDDLPEGGAWQATTKIYSGTMKASLTFEADDVWKVYVNGDSWCSGTYRFEDKPGTSTLFMTGNTENGDTKISGVDNGTEASFKPADGVYTIKIDLPRASETEFKFFPPQDGTLPGTETPEEPETATVVVTLTATESTYTFPAKMTLYSDNTFKIEISYYKDANETPVYTNAATGTYSKADSENPMSPLTLTYDDIYSSIAGATDMLEITSSDYTTFAYAVTVEYNTPSQEDTPAMSMVFNFTGSLTLSA